MSQLHKVWLIPVSHGLPAPWKSEDMDLLRIHGILYTRHIQRHGTEEAKESCVSEENVNLF